MTDNTFNGGFPLQIAVVVTSAAQLAGVYAFLGGAAPAAVAAGNAPVPAPAKQDTAKSSATAETLTPENPAPAGTGETATTAASLSDGEIDAHGHPWSADLHASTKGKTKDGLWRMKVGVTRPAPLPGFPVEENTGTSSATPITSATTSSATVPAPAPTAEDDDEFAAFRNAAAVSEATDAAAAASAPARQFSDADLGALCNQAAVKLGDPAPVKELISRYVPEGQVQHSRNIPAEAREQFVKDVEAKAGIEFAG